MDLAYKGFTVYPLTDTLPSTYSTGVKSLAKVLPYIEYTVENWSLSPYVENSVLPSRINVKAISGCDTANFFIILDIALLSTTSRFKNFALTGTL